VSSFSTRDAEGLGHCGSEVFIAEEVDGVGDKLSGDTTTGDVERFLEAFLRTCRVRTIFLTAKVLRF
jgi:hypothetical protein